MKLLKEGKELPDELHEKLTVSEEKLSKLEEPKTSTPASTPSKGDVESMKVMREKVGLLNNSFSLWFYSLGTTYNYINSNINVNYCFYL